MAGEHSGLPTLDFQDDPDPGGGSGGQQPQNVKNSAQVKSGPVRTGWLNTMETLIDSGVLTWDQRCARNAGSKNGTHANARSSKNWHAETHANFCLENFRTQVTIFKKICFVLCHFEQFCSEKV